MKLFLTKIIGSIVAFIKAHTVVSIVTAAAVVSVSVGTPIIIGVINDDNKPAKDTTASSEITDSDKNNSEDNSFVASTPDSSSDTSTSSDTTSSDDSTVSSDTNTSSDTDSSGEPENTKKIQTLNYQNASFCIDGVILVRNNAGKVGMIDSFGKLLVDYKYDNGLICVGGYAVFDKHYVYDKTGKLVFEDKNVTIKTCGNGIVLLTETGSWKADGYDEAKQNGADENELEEYYTWKSRDVYKKLDGTEIYSVFGYGGQFNKQGYAWTVRYLCSDGPDSTVEIINSKGEVVKNYGDEHDVIADYAWLIGEDGYILTDDMIMLGETRYLNLTGVKNDIFESVWQGDSLYNWAEKQGSDVNEFVFYPSYDKDGNPCASINGLSVMTFNNNYYLFDIEKNKIVAEYTVMSVSDSKHILVRNSKDKWGYIDRNGKEVKFYDDATQFDDGYAMVKINGMLYVINESFEIVSEGIKGDSASALCNKFFSVTDGSKTTIVKFNP